MARIWLKNKRCYALVDAVDLEFLKQWVWYLDSHGYPARKTWLRGQKGKHESVKMHRALLTALPGQTVDHANGNRRDNRRSNLRLADRSHQQWNKKRHKNNVSGFKGVCLDKWRGTWKAEICVHWKRHYLGSFPTPEEAGKAYDRAAKLYFGEFAKLNNPS